MSELDSITELNQDLDINENSQECSKLLTDLFEVKKVNQIIELEPKRRFNIGKLIKSVENCYDCKVSKFEDTDKVLSEDESYENENKEDYYDIELVSKSNKILISDKRNGKKHEINLAEFRNFLENKIDLKSDEYSDNETTVTEESKEDKRFHFLKFELILREFYQKNGIRQNLKNNYNTNEVKKVNLGLSNVKRPVVANSYQGKNNLFVSPVIKKNFFEDHKEEIKNINVNRRKTMILENNMIDKLKNDLQQKRIPNTQISKPKLNLDEIKEEKISSFTPKIEEFKDDKDFEMVHKNSYKISKRTSIFDVKISFNCNEEQDR